jgi:predicted ATPase
LAARIAFIGTHGVGKTTLCYDLAAALKRRGVAVDIVKEVARQSPLPINRQTSLEAQLWILSTQIAEEIRSAAGHDVVVCDRSVLDNYAYLVLAASRQPWLEPLVSHWMRGYDLLIKVPLVGTPSPDGVRDTDQVFLEAIDRLVDELLAERHVEALRLPASRRDDWAAIVTEQALALPGVRAHLSS